MKAQQIYDKAQRNGVEFECDCTSISLQRWESLMKGATRANKKIVDKIVSKNYSEFDVFVKYWNPYNHLKTQTHLIFVHSGIENFFKINN